MTSNHNTRTRGRGGARGAWVGASAEEGEGGVSAMGRARPARARRGPSAGGLGICSTAGGPPVQRPAASTSSLLPLPAKRSVAAPEMGRPEIWPRLAGPRPTAPRSAGGPPVQRPAASSPSPSGPSAWRWLPRPLPLHAFRAALAPARGRPLQPLRRSAWASGGG